MKRLLYITLISVILLNSCMRDGIESVWDVKVYNPSIHPINEMIPQTGGYIFIPVAVFQTKFEFYSESRLFKYRVFRNNELYAEKTIFCDSYSNTLNNIYIYITDNDDPDIAQYRVEVALSQGFYDTSVWGNAYEAVYEEYESLMTAYQEARTDASPFYPEFDGARMIATLNGESFEIEPIESWTCTVLKRSLFKKELACKMKSDYSINFRGYFPKSGNAKALFPENVNNKGHLLLSALGELHLRMDKATDKGFTSVGNIKAEDEDRWTSLLQSLYDADPRAEYDFQLKLSFE